MATQQEVDRLDKIRFRHSESSHDWAFQLGGQSEEFMVARLIPRTAQVPVLQLTQECGYQDRDFILHAHSDIGFLLGLLQRAGQAVRDLKKELQKKEQTPNFAAECAMKCDEFAFRQFLSEQKGIDPADGERVISAVRELLQIKSRSELNTNPEAAARWKSLRAEYDAWRNFP